MTLEWRKQRIKECKTREEAINFVNSQHKPFRENAMKMVNKYHKNT